MFLTGFSLVFDEVDWKTRKILTMPLSNGIFLTRRLHTHQNPDT